MNIHEYQARSIFERYGIPVPRGEVADTPAAAGAIAARLGRPVVVKAQVLVGGRGKAGGIKLASGSKEVEDVAGRIIGMDIKGIKVRKVLVAEATEIDTELYFGFVLDRTSKRMVAMASAAGGVDIEEVARTAPEQIVRLAVDPFLGFQEYQARELAFRIGLDKRLVRDFVKIACTLYRVFVENDAALAEINPLVIAAGRTPATRDGQLLALDAKVVLDDNALFRHPDLAALRDTDEEDPYERRARERGISYVKLDGEIGCMVNGAGLAMGTMDVIKLYGGSPANFLDVGGGARADTVAAALDIILSDPNVKAVLFNIFGGITRCDEVAQGIVTALGQQKRQVPIVVRLVGTNEEEGRKILQAANMVAVSSMTDAARQVVAALRQAKGEAR